MPLVRVVMLPSLLTLGNFTCGFASMVMTLHALRVHMEAEGMARVLASRQPPVYVPPAEPFLARNPAGGGEDPAEAAPPGTGEASGSDSDGLESVRDGTLPLPQTVPAGPDPAMPRYMAKAREQSGLLMGYACLLVFLGMVFDTLDGRVARMTGTDSRFGAELDSLADVSTFGLAPAVLIASHWVLVLPEGKDWWGQVVLFAAGYAACAALRLARYNVESGTVDRNYFFGLPSPGAAGCVASTALLLRHETFHGGWWIRVAAWTGERMTPEEAQARALACYALLVGFLMVTRVAFVHVPNRYLSGQKHFMSLVLCLFAIVALVMWPYRVLAAAFNGYVAWCLLGHAWRKLFRRRWRKRRPMAAEARVDQPPPVSS